MTMTSPTEQVEHCTRVQVSFENYEDLSRRLVLLPRIEDEGRGAVVASYQPNKNQEESNGLLTKPISACGNGKPEDEPTASSNASHDSSECRDEKEVSSLNLLKTNDSDNPPLVGLMLVGAHQEAEFASILSFMRGEEGPIVLEFESTFGGSSSPCEAVRLDKSTSSGGDENSCTDSSSTDGDGHNATDGRDVPQSITSTSTNNSNITMSAVSGRLSAWGSRMRVAAEVASQAAVQSINAAAANSHRARQNSSDSNTLNKECDMHVQTSLGAFLPLTPNSPRNSELTVTISSVLYMRKSAVEPCPHRGYVYQWYKALPDKDYDRNDGWILLPGANHAAFQPSTTEIGYKLMCEVTIDPVAHPDSSDDEDSATDESADRSTDATILRCTTPHVVAADLSLFNGARQALVRGAHFTGLLGQGKAQGRTFRVKVEIGYHKRQKTQQVANVVQIDQVAGETAEPLHSKPLRHVTAQSVASNSKALALRFQPSDLDHVLGALIGDEGVLELVAPNRFARESLLLALGIANFKGKPADLESTTVLFLPEDDNDEIDSWGSSSASSCGTHEQQVPPATVVENLVLSSGSSKLAIDDASILSHTSAEDLSTIASNSNSIINNIPSSSPQASSVNDREAILEKEIAFLRSKLARKDKALSELQRQVTRNDSAKEEAQYYAQQWQRKTEDLEIKLQENKKLQRAAESTSNQLKGNLQKLKDEHAAELAKMKQQLEHKSKSIFDLEKMVKSHQNEKAVLSAAVEARESKLAKLADLQESYVQLSSKVSQQDSWRKELEETTVRYQELKLDLKNMTRRYEASQQQLKESETATAAARRDGQIAQATTASSREELAAIQAKNQKLKAERNSYKQKADSLSKEIGRICRQGRTLADVERILANDEARQEEVALLRKQKRKALEDCHAYRKSYEQSRTAQQLLMETSSSTRGISSSPSKKKQDPSQNAALLLERNIELERLVTELTEYVNAKEMQLETMKQVNNALQEEIHGLAQANMHKDEI